MLAYVQALINIALRKSGPEDLPDSGFLLGLTFAVCLLLQVILSWIDYGQYGGSGLLFKTTAVSVLIVVAPLWLLLQVMGYASRYRRTLTALVGTSALLNLISLPISLWSLATQGAEPGSPLPGILLFALVLWSLSIDGHIFARAVSRPYIVGVFLAIALFFAQVSALFSLLPEPMTN